MRHPQIKKYLLCLLIGFIVMIFSGCHKNVLFRPEGVQPFVPVCLEFKGTYRDVSIEQEIRKRLFCRKCLFQHAQTTSSPYTLTIEYDRIMDLRSLGLVVLTGALAPIEAEFSYSLLVQIREKDKLLQKYIYTKQTIEDSNSAFENIFNPFHKENGMSDEIFAELVNAFLKDVLTDRPLP